jgi:hypothetical protein
MSDGELAQQVCAGRTAFFLALVERHKGSAWRVAWRVLGRREGNY